MEAAGHRLDVRRRARHEHDAQRDVTLGPPRTTGQTPTMVQRPGRAAQAADRQDVPNAVDETIHPTASHPWLTADRGWQRAGVLRVGEPVVTADGSSTVVIALHVVPGAADMWDLTVSNVHTFVVGAGAYVVHNCAKPVTPGNGPSTSPFQVDWNDGSTPPQPGQWTWKGNGPLGSSRGNWVHTTTGESLHPDLGHGPPLGPTWDYKDSAGQWWWIWPDGTMTPKS